MKRLLIPAAALAVGLSAGVAALAQAPAAPPVQPSSTHVVANSGNGIGNTVVIQNDGTAAGKTVISNVRNGIGNRLIIVNGKQVDVSPQELKDLMKDVLPPRPGKCKVAPKKIDPVDALIEQTIQDALREALGDKR